jgi:hypothetical protein
MIHYRALFDEFLPTPDAQPGPDTTKPGKIAAIADTAPNDGW